MIGAWTFPAGRVYLVAGIIPAGPDALAAIRRFPVSERLPLIYIAGSSYSGSTLMDLLLGSHPGIESLGEAKKIATVQLPDGGAAATCNCGDPVSSCAFWQTVLPGNIIFRADDPEANADLCRRALSFRGRQVVLDNSKNIGRALMLQRSGLFDLHVLHMVRDSRAVVFSHRRKAERRAHDQGYRLAPTARQWERLNRRLARAFRSRAGTGYVRVRYEDLVDRPEEEVRRVLHEVSLPWDPQTLKFREGRHHGIEGNRMRLDTKREIVRDDEYLAGLGCFEWCAITALTARGLRDFGYRWSREAARPINSR